MNKFYVRLMFSLLITIAPYLMASAQSTKPAQAGMARLENSKVKEPTEAPPSRNHKEIKVDQSVTYRLPPPDSIQPAKGKGRLQVGVVRPLSLNPILKSKWFNLGPDGRVGVFGLVSSGAVQVRVHFTAVDLPRGAKLFVYSMKNPGEIYGPFTGRGPSGDKTFWTPPVDGDGVIVEYFTPGSSPRFKEKPPPFLVSAISHIFRN